MRHAAFLFLLAVALLLAASVAEAQDAKTTVKIRIVDAASGKITPAMICVRSEDDWKVHLPPDGRICDSVSNTKEFYQGILFDPDPNWIGPVRDMLPGDNINGRAGVYGARPSIPYWRAPITHMTSGDFSIQLPEGRWRVYAARGMEHIPVEARFRTSGEETLEKTIKIARWIDLPGKGWFSGDIHVHHPILNDQHKKFLMQYTIAEDLHLANILEMSHHEPLPKGTDFKQLGFGPEFWINQGNYWLCPNQEGPRSTFGHIIALNTRELVHDDDNYDLYDIAFRRLRKCPDTLVGFSHFAWNGCALPRGFPWYVAFSDFDFVELLQFSQINRMDYYDYLNLGFRLTAAAGSDVPWGSTVGEVRTYVHTGSDFDAHKWYAGLKKGNSFVSNGPVLEFTVDGKLPGSDVPKSAGSRVKVAAKVFGHPLVAVPKLLTIVSNEGVLKEVEGDGKRMELSLEMEVPVERSRWIVASALGENNSIAHTTPVYVIVDGRPHFCPERGPAIIDKQIESMKKIGEEFKNGQDSRSRGVVERLLRAGQIYTKLKEDMERSRKK